MKCYLLSIGCNFYSSSTLSNLTGAENDASCVFNCLVKSEYRIYDNNSSSLLLSPNITEVKSGLENILFEKEPADIFTLFFAGHGGVSTGTYYLCLKDTRADRIGFSALSLSEIFRMVSSSGVKHLNLIIDACNTGGLVNDLVSIVKPELMGAKGSLGISILAAAASDEYASEKDGQGALTGELLNYINGSKRLTASFEYLDLVSIGRQISIDFINSASPQTPSSWGINLYGPSIFSKNPFFDSDVAIGSHDFSYIPPVSKIGITIQNSKKDFWDILENIEETDSPKLLIKILQKLFKKTEKTDDLLTIVTGIGYRFIAQIHEKANFIKLDIISALLAALSPYIGDKKIDIQINVLIKMFNHFGMQCLDNFIQAIERDDHFLVIKEGAGFEIFSNYYYLSIRISRILGMLSLLSITDSKNIAKISIAIRMIHEKYKNQFMCMCDNQAPFLYVFFKTFINSKIKDEVKSILNFYLADFLKSRGQVSRGDLSPEKAVSFILQRYTQKKINFELRARPGCVGTVLLSSAVDYGLEEDLDEKMHLLDRCSFHLFVPFNQKEFSDDSIEKGQNLLVRCGFDFWNTNEFSNLCNNHIKKYSEDNFESTNELELICCIASSFVMPDRLPIMYK